jgi:carbon-monoxide dehydrogenase medium subunit
MSFLRQYRPEARVLAGGTDLLVAIRDRRVKPRFLVNIKGLQGLGGIEFEEQKGLRVGSVTKVAELENNRVIKEKFSLLSEAAGHLGSVQVRNLATVGGNLCWAAPSAELAPPFLVLDTRVRILNPAGDRVVSLAEFFRGPGETVLQAGEIVRELLVPASSSGMGVATAYLRYSPRRALDLAVVNVAVFLRVDGKLCTEARIALGAVAPIPFRASKSEKAIQGRTITEDTIREAAEAAKEEVRPITDVRGTAEYRKHMAGILTERAIWQALQRLPWKP